MRPDERHPVARPTDRRHALAASQGRGRVVPHVAPARPPLAAAAVAMLRLAAAPPLLPRRMWPRNTVQNVVDDVVLPVLNAVLDRVDLTQLILDHVSIPRILDAVDVDGVAARVDVSPIIDRVLAEVDLPEMVRSSSDSLFSDAVLGVRLESASADDMVDRFFSRILRRGHGKARVAGKQGTP